MTIFADATDRWIHELQVSLWNTGRYQIQQIENADSHFVQQTRPRLEQECQCHKDAIGEWNVIYHHWCFASFTDNNDDDDYQIIMPTILPSLLICDRNEDILISGEHLLWDNRWIADLSVPGWCATRLRCELSYSRFCPVLMRGNDQSEFVNLPIVIDDLLINWPMELP